LVGEELGTLVGPPITSVGDIVGLTVGITDGEVVGKGVGLPAI